MTRSIIVLDGHTLTHHLPGQAAVLGEPSWDELSKLGDVTVFPRTPDHLIVERIGDASIVLTNKTPLTRQTLEQLPNLRYIGVMATGVNVIDLEAAQDMKIVVRNAPGYSSESVAQHVFALMLEVCNRVAAHSTSVQNGDWSSCPDFSYTVGPLVELAGKTLGIVGMGAIGQRVAQLAHAFGMNIAAAHQSSMKQVSLPGIKIDWMPLDQLMAEVDMLTLHCPLTDKTENMINEQSLQRVKPSLLLFNTGRGQLIDEAALAKALRENQIAGAGLDVLRNEPPSASHPLLDCPNCVVTPHIAWATREARQRLMNIVVERVEAYTTANAHS